MARLEVLLVTGVKDDLVNSLDLYDRIAEDWEKGQIIWFNVINELEDSRQTYMNNRDSILLISDDRLRGDVIKYYRKSGMHLIQLRNTQQRKYDIQGRYDLAKQDLRLKNPDLTDDDAHTIVVQAMGPEDKELTYIREQIPTLVAGLERFKGDARSLLDRLADD